MTQNSYVYLLSSLPMLHFGAPPPVTSDGLLWSCEGIVPEDALGTLRAILKGERYTERPANATLARWRWFDTALRNEFVKVRAARRHVDPSKYIREGGDSGISTNHIAISAYRVQGPLESERILDAAKWRALDELAAGHYFDLDLLFIYAVKLSILEKWALIDSADRPAMLEDAITSAV